MRWFFTEKWLELSKARCAWITLHNLEKGWLWLLGWNTKTNLFLCLGQRQLLWLTLWIFQDLNVLCQNCSNLC